LARELAIGVFADARLLPKRFSADFVLARSADPALQLQNGLCANHALFALSAIGLLLLAKHLDLLGVFDDNF
jgi:hypothetical protein